MLAANGEMKLIFGKNDLERTAALVKYVYPRRMEGITIWEKTIHSLEKYCHGAPPPLTFVHDDVATP